MRQLIDPSPILSSGYENLGNEHLFSTQVRFISVLQGGAKVSLQSLIWEIIPY